MSLLAYTLDVMSCHVHVRCVPCKAICVWQAQQQVLRRCMSFWLMYQVPWVGFVCAGQALLVNATFGPQFVEGAWHPTPGMGATAYVGSCGRVPLLRLHKRCITNTCSLKIRRPYSEAQIGLREGKDCFHMHLAYAGKRKITTYYYYALQMGYGHHANAGR